MKKTQEIRRRIPHILALVGLVPEMLVTFGNGDLLQATILLAVVCLNVFALRTLPNTPVGIEIGALVGDSCLALLTGLDYANRGSVAIHYVWFFSAAGFLIAAIVFCFKNQRQALPEDNPDP